MSQSQHVRFNLIPEIGVGYLKISGMQNLYIRITFPKIIQTIVTDDICLVTFCLINLYNFHKSLKNLFPCGLLVMMLITSNPLPGRCFRAEDLTKNPLLAAIAVDF